MTPKEKAKELVDKYLQISESIDWTDEENYKKAQDFNNQLGNDVIKYWNELAKQSALTAVDEILKSNSNINVFISSKDVKYKNKAETEVKSDCKENLKYWQEVKKEIEKL